MKSDHLILRKIVKSFASRYHILTLKCTKYNFGWYSAPDPLGRSLRRSPYPLAGIKGAYRTSKERRKQERRGGDLQGLVYTPPEKYCVYIHLLFTISGRHNMK